MTSIVVCLLVLFSVIYIQGSIIKFESSVRSIKSPLTEEVSLRCSLNDTVPSVGGSGSIVGRKKRQATRSPLHLKGPESEERQSPNSHKSNKRVTTVTNSSTDADFVTAIVVSKNGNNIAAISEHLPAKALVNQPGLTVAGSLSENNGEQGYLQLTWEHPTQAVTGNYECHLDAVDQSGRSYDFSKTAQISSDEVSLDDLVNFVQTLAREKEVLNATITDMTLLNQKQDQEIQFLKQENQDLQAKINKTSTKIFFSAVVTHEPSGRLFPNGQTIIYDKVLSNVGAAYQSSSGVFTCPIAGYYAFSINGMIGSDTAHLHLNVNDKYVIQASSSDHSGYQSISNYVILKLNNGDTVKVVPFTNSYLYSHGSEQTATFSGHLIQAL